MCLLILVRYVRTLSVLRNINQIQREDGFCHSWWFLLGFWGEYLVCLVHSFDGLPFREFSFAKSISFTGIDEEVFEREEKVEYTLDTFIAFFSVFKLYLVFRMFQSWFSIHNWPAMFITSKKLDFRMNFWFSLKCDIQHQPFRMAAFILFVTALPLSSMIRLAELPYIDISDPDP